ncbi:PDZ domain-containing protein sprite [Rhodnius prolixus]|uniref:PDZ domain-containing protein sprite n=1 Tax=Rhodnius prolixus TaxID=13249 RepID=UPI003D188FF6
MTRMGSSSQLGDVRRYNKGIRSSKKSILYSDYYEEEDKREENNLANQRSISLGALHQGSVPLEPRMAQLETLEAKMASIEVSLSTTPRRKKSGSTTSTPVPSSIHTIINSNNMCNNNNNNNNNTSNNNINNNSQPVMNGNSKDVVKELETLRNGYKDKENVMNSLKVWGRSQHTLNDRDKKLAQERLVRLKSELDAKRLTIKNIKLALDTIDISDNIDVRIQQAELEYQLGREELNLLSLLEETRNLQSCLEENVVSQQTIFSYIGNSAVSVHGLELMYDAKSPQFGASQREEGSLYIEWAADGSGLSKGDRLLEVNGKLVIGKTKEDMCRLLSVSPSPAQLVVLRKHSQRPEQIMSHLQAELSVVKEKAGEAERTRDSFRSDNLRLTHRISYLEEQVAELLERAREAKPRPVPQVFQKGNQVALVANLPGLADRKPPPPVRPISQDEVRSAKSVEVLVEKPKRKKEPSSLLSRGARSTNSLDTADIPTPSTPSRHPRRRHDQEPQHQFTNPVHPQHQQLQQQLQQHIRHGELRTKHLRDARSSLLAFMDKKCNSSYNTDFDSEPSYNARDIESGNDRNSESSVRYYKRGDKVRPVPPKKPVRLSLHRATSLQSVDNENKSLKRTHKSDMPSMAMPQIPSHHQSNGHVAHLEGNWC